LEVLERLGCQQESLRLWSEKGLLAFPPDKELLEPEEEASLEFLVHLHSAKVPEEIRRAALATLPKPIRCNLGRTVYSMLHGWAEVGDDDPFETIQENLGDFIQSKAEEEEWEEIRSILDLCLNALFSRIEAEC